MTQYDLVVIGGGAGGLNVVSGAAQLGLKVALVEKTNQLGGDCLHHGCVPSKTLIQAAKVYHQMCGAEKFGLRCTPHPVDLAEVNQVVAKVIATIQQHDEPKRFQDYGADIFFGEGLFRDSTTFIVNGQSIKSKRFVIATGSSPVVPPIEGLAAAGYLTNESIFSLQVLPKRLVILGAGAIGLEMAQAFLHFGVDVTVIDMLPTLLPQLDNQVVAQYQQLLAQQGLKFYFNTQVTRVDKGETGKIVHAKKTDGTQLTFEADDILVATGRKPNVQNLGLDNIGIQCVPSGIVVSSRLQTAQKHIYAIGDVVNSPMKFTHMAEYHASIVMANAVFKLPKKLDLRVVPAVIFTEPEFAVVGLSEHQLQQQKKPYQVQTFYFNEIDRAITNGMTEGMIKILTHRGKILGATIFGEHAGELIAELVLAMRANIHISHIAASIHAYPTLAQINRRVVNQHYGKKLFSDRAKKIVYWLNRLLP